MDMPCLSMYFLMYLIVAVSCVYFSYFFHHRIFLKIYDSRIISF